jgi:hypothetical protein
MTAGLPDHRSMEDWVYRALEKWPDVPALFGWLGLDRRGRWTIRGAIISRPQIIDTINPNYAADAHGRWYFQNGPQRGYVALESAPLVLRSDGRGGLLTHTGRAVEQADAGWLDESGALWLRTAHGPAILEGEDLGWALERLRGDRSPVDEALLAEALALPSGAHTRLSLRLGDTTLPLGRLDFDAAPQALGFVRRPAPRPDD